MRSCEPERAWRPSGLIATAFTASSWPAKRTEELAGSQVPESERAVSGAGEGMAPNRGSPPPR